MSLVGNLEDLGLGEILQIVSLSRKSGILRLHSRGRQGTIVFRLGQVIQATSSTHQDNLGEALIRKGAIDLATLRSALAYQDREGFRERLGSILCNHHDVPAEIVEEVVREQIESVVYSLFAWAEGTFDFELQENLEAVDAIRLDPMQFMLSQGLNPQFLAIEGSRIVDEQRHFDAQPSPVPPASGQPEAGRHEPDVDEAFDLLQMSPAARAVLPEADVPLVLVDDDEDTLRELTVLLNRNGFRVFPFARSEDTLIQVDSLHRQGEQPLVVVDLIMPRMDGTGILGGMELLELLRSNFPTLRVLVVSDYHNLEAERRIGQMGYPFILKPRRAQLADYQELAAFAPLFLDNLATLMAGKAVPCPSDVVNLADELRLELGEDFAVMSERVEPSTGISLLRSMLSELNDPGLGGGITLLVLRFAAEFVNRAVIFVVKRDEIVGLGQFGIADREGSADEQVRQLRIPRDADSVFAEVLEAGHPAVIRPEQIFWNRYLFDKLGDGLPDEVFLGPIVSEGRVVAVLYGDNLPELKPICNTESLEIFLSQAGIAMEKALLARKLQENSREGL